MNWLHGTPTTVNPRGPYSSWSASSWLYCGVSPQRLATLTINAGRPAVSAPSVVGSPWSVAMGWSSRSVMPAPAPAAAGSFRVVLPRVLETAQVVGDVDGVLAQGLERDDVEGAL